MQLVGDEGLQEGKGIAGLLNLQPQMAQISAFDPVYVLLHGCYYLNSIQRQSAIQPLSFALMSVYRMQQPPLSLIVQSMNDPQFHHKVIQPLAHIYNDVTQADRLLEAEIPDFKAKKIKPLFAHKVTQSESGELEYSKYSCTDICCKIEIGHFCCGDIAPGSTQLNELGLGISLYLKFVVYLVCFFAIATVLVSAHTFIFYQISNQNGAFQWNLNSVLFSSTIGTLSSNLYQCTFIANQLQAKMTAECKVGNIKLYDPIYTNRSLANVETCQIVISSSLSGSDTILGATLSKNCSSSQCNITLNNPSPDPHFLFVSVAYSCEDPQYSIASYPISTRDIILLTVAADLAVVVLFLVWVYLQKRSEKKLTQVFATREVSLDDFTIELKGLKVRTELLSTRVSDFILNFNREVMGLTFKDITISKIKVCDNANKIGYQYKKKQLYEELYKDVYEKQLEQGIDPYNMNYQEFRQRIDFRKFRSNIERVFQKFRNYIYKGKNEPYSIFITLETPQMVNNVFSICEKAFCGGGLNLIIDQKTYQVERACRPDLIKWENLSKNSFLRTSLSWMITLVILAASYITIASAQIGQSILLSKYDFDLDCSLLYDFSNLQQWDPSRSSDSNWLNCYCSTHISETFSHPECKSWLGNYSFSVFSPMFISLVIVVFNMVVAFVFRKLSKFQKHSNITSELYSYVIKRTLLFLINAGLIIVIVNQKLGVVSFNPFVKFLFGGHFNNFDASWYYSVGMVIIFTNVFNIVIPLFNVVVRFLIKGLRELFDTKCFKRVTSAHTKKEYFDIYSGIPFPIEQRYAEILSLLMLTFAYNAVIPLLNLVAMMSFLFQLLSDKIMIYCVYRRPINYDHRLQKKVRSTILLCVLLHTFTSIFFLPQQGINISSGVNFDMTSITSNQILKFIVSQAYIYPYLVLLALLVLWVFFSNTFIRMWRWITKSCGNRRNKEQDYRSVEKNQLKIYELFSNHQIDQLLRVNRVQILKSQREQDLYLFKKGIDTTQQDLVMGAVVRYVNKQGQIDIPDDWQKLDSYRKILFQERAQLQNHKNQRVKVKLNGMPGYDPILQKDNMLADVLRLESVIHSYFQEDLKD